MSYFGERIVVGFTGSREWQPGQDAQGAYHAMLSVFSSLEASAGAGRSPIVVYGDAANGIDAWVRKELRNRGWCGFGVSAPWIEGKGAGLLRNEWLVEILAAHNGTLYAIWNGKSGGTRDCWQRAGEAGVPLHRWALTDRAWHSWDLSIRDWS